jgi:hypothetical protein
MLDNKEIYKIAEPYFLNLNNASNYVRFAIQNQALIQSDLLSDLLKTPIGHLLNNDSELDKNLGLEAISRFKIKYPNHSLSPLINKTFRKKH